jgi:hypothetical protein
MIVVMMEPVESGGSGGSGSVPVMLVDVPVDVPDELVPEESARAMGLAATRSDRTSAICHTDLFNMDISFAARVALRGE